MGLLVQGWAPPAEQAAQRCFYPSGRSSSAAGLGFFGSGLSGQAGSSRFQAAVVQILTCLGHYLSQKKSVGRSVVPKQLIASSAFV